MSGLKKTGIKCTISKRMKQINTAKKLVVFQSGLVLFGSNIGQIIGLSPLDFNVLEKGGKNFVIRVNNVPKEMDKIISSIRSKIAKAPSWRA